MSNPAAPGLAPAAAERALGRPVFRTGIADTRSRRILRPPAWLTPKAVSLELGISLRTVRRRIADRTLAVARLSPRRLLVDATRIVFHADPRLDAVGEPRTLAGRIAQRQQLEKRAARKARRTRARERQRRELFVAAAVRLLARRFLDRRREVFDVVFGVRRLAAVSRSSRSRRAIYHDVSKGRLPVVDRSNVNGRTIWIGWRDAVEYFRQPVATRAVIAIVVDFLIAEPLGVSVDVRDEIIDRFCTWLSDRRSRSSRSVE